MLKKAAFVGVGVCKAGSASIYNKLVMHPEIGSAIAGPEKELNKEVQYFNVHKEAIYNDEMYQNQFDTKKFFGEWTPTYICCDETLDNIKSYNKDIKILYMVKSPLSRIWSEYNSFKEKTIYTNINNPSFSELIHSSFKEASITNIKNPLHKFIIYNSKYASHLDRLYQRFPEKNIMVIKQEDYINNFEGTIHNIQGFIGANPELNKKIRNYHGNKTITHDDFSEFTTQEDYLKEILYKDNKRAKEVYNINYEL